MKKLILTALALTISAPVISAPTVAQQILSSAIEQCAVIEEDFSRLECYDQIAKTHNLSGQHTDQAQLGGTGQWTVEKKTDPIDDTKTVNIFLIADSGSSRFGKPIMLVARCDSEKTEMFIDWQIYLGSEAKVTLRIGDDDAKKSKWTLSSDRQKSFNKSPINTLKAMLTTDKMVAQITPFNQKPSTAVFNIAGLDEAIKPLREACVW
ncbi:type VI secretion system-associated protein TagO [Oceanisphaera profunda]|uniref:type VI secretion system-associated protein TagO n=1 Tax=Oceanisphaera profunda TaxID=1416627 RepID=UPI001374790C|nr:type VI secretion system-associated protein TagO [Oceanisphaera profunda]